MWVMWVVVVGSDRKHRYEDEDKDMVQVFTTENIFEAMHLQKVVAGQKTLSSFLLVIFVNEMVCLIGSNSTLNLFAKPK